MARAAQARSSGGGQTPDALLEAASRRYTRFGPRKTTMGEVAREAGCSRATLYAHFPSKEALYAGLLERETLRFLARLEVAVASPGSARDKLGRIFEATLRTYAGNPVLAGAMRGDSEMALERVARPVREAHEQQLIELLRNTVEEGIAQGSHRQVDAGAVAYLMYHLGRMLVLGEVSGRGEQPLERILPVMDDLLANGINARPEEPEGDRA